jgi:signal transduction histidine kinase
MVSGSRPNGILDPLRRFLRPPGLLLGGEGAAPSRILDGDRLQEVLEVLADGVLVVDVLEHLVLANSRARTLLGLGEAILQRPYWEVLRHPAIRAVLQAGTAGPAEGELRLADEGPDRVLALRAAPLPRGGVCLVLDDVSERARLEAMRRDFVANVSHELKTPITAIQGLADTIVDDPAMDLPTMRRFISRIGEQCVRVTQLVRDLLSLARAEGGGGEQRPLDLTLLVQDSLKRHRPAAERKSHRVSSELPGGPLTVLGESEGLRQVVDNLLANAIAYTPEAGCIQIRLYAEAGQAELTVRDDGIGIEPAHQERIFERFFRVDAARSRSTGGTGLGLAIVKHVVQAHRGTVSVESRPGEGATFRVRLPLTPAGG